MQGVLSVPSAFGTTQNYEFTLRPIDVQTDNRPSPYTIHAELLETNLLITFRFHDYPMSFRQFTDALNDYNFVKEFCRVMKSFNYDFFFESTKIDFINDTFAVILVGTLAFQNMKTNYSAFAEHFNTAHQTISIDSKSNDGTRLLLTNPRMDNKANSYLSMKQFVTEADDASLVNFFHALSLELRGTTFPVYLSTHGTAVPYFHFRIQHNNKYYLVPDDVLKAAKDHNDKPYNFI